MELLLIAALMMFLHDNILLLTVDRWEDGVFPSTSGGQPTTRDGGLLPSTSSGQPTARDGGLFPSTSGDAEMIIEQE